MISNIWVKSILAICVACFLSSSTEAQTKKPVATKYYEFTWGAGSAPWGYPTAALQDMKRLKELRTRVSRYIRLTRLKRIKPYVIIYHSRVSNRSYYGSVYRSRTEEIKQIFRTFGYNTDRITFVDGGFGWAYTELWIVPKNAEPPVPKPIFGKEAELRCPNIYITSSPLMPKTADIVKFRVRNLN